MSARAEIHTGEGSLRETLTRDSSERSGGGGESSLTIGMADYLLFDGACGVCAAFARWASRRDRRRRFVFLPYQEIPAEALAPLGLTPQHCARRLYVITRRGRVLGGVFGLNAFFSQLSPWRLLVYVIYAVPPLLLLEMVIYALVARHRHRLSQWLGLSACHPT